jgi:hypothetical protein
MEKQKKQKVRYEFYEFQGTNAIADTQINLKLENPAQVTFINTGPLTTLVTINNIFKLNCVGDYVTGAAAEPYELILSNNQDEIDVTNYSIVIQAGGVLKVICKYFVN